jgi:hypothetical protein
MTVPCQSPLMSCAKRAPAPNASKASNNVRYFKARLCHDARRVRHDLATTDARLIRLANEKRLTTDVAFARQSLLALSLGVTTLGRHGASKAEVKTVGRFLLNSTLSALVRKTALTRTSGGNRPWARLIHNEQQPNTSGILRESFATLGSEIEDASRPG